MSLSPPRRLERIGRWLKGLAIVLFVVWHLVFMAYRNVADLWGDELIAWAKPRIAWEKAEPSVVRVGRITRGYAAYAGAEQGWSMFAAPLARRAVFPAVRIEFVDGSDERLHSGNEPDPAKYWRVGGWRQRKLEDHLAAWSADEECKGEEAALWKNYTFWVYRHWRESRADAPREVKTLVLLRRPIRFPEPGQPLEYAPPDESVIASYTPDGRRAP